MWRGMSNKNVYIEYKYNILNNSLQCFDKAITIQYSYINVSHPLLMECDYHFEFYNKVIENYYGNRKKYETEQ